MIITSFVVVSCDLCDSERFECGNNLMSKEQCLEMNCCYDNSTASLTPKCYYKTIGKFNIYVLYAVTKN